MDAFEMTLLFDYYGGLLTDRQRTCFDMRYNQDLSLGEIGQVLQISRQAVYDNLTRSEALLRKMEENTGCIRVENFWHWASAKTALCQPLRVFGTYE